MIQSCKIICCYSPGKDMAQDGFEMQMKEARTVWEYFTFFSGCLTTYSLSLINIELKQFLKAIAIIVAFFQRFKLWENVVYAQLKN